MEAHVGTKLAAIREKQGAYMSVLVGHDDSATIKKVGESVSQSVDK